MGLATPWRAAPPAVFLLAAAGAPLTAGAQVIRDFRSSRPLAGESRLALQLELHDGAFTLARGTRDRLYHLALAFDPERFQPLSRLDAGAGRLELGLQGEHGGGLRLRPSARLVQDGTVRLSPEVEWSLDLVLGGAEADFDLEQISFTRLALDAGASRTSLHFPHTNAALCREATFRVGAGELTLEHFGNSGCRDVTLRGEFGRFTLDFSGAMPGDMRADLEVRAGTLVLRLPRGTGVRLQTSGFASLLRVQGLIKHDGVWLTQDYEAARRKLDLHLTSTFARVLIEWTTP